MKKIYIIRHGETIDNKNNVIVGNTNGGKITKEGLEQAEELSSYFKNKKIDAIYCSTLRRAIKTAKIINKGLNRKMIFDSNLNERSVGIFAGKPREEYKKVFEKQEDKINFRPKDGESYLDVLERVKVFLKRLESIKEDNILVVSHGRTIKILLNYISNRSLLNQIEQDNGCLNILTYNGSFEVGAINKTVSF